MILLTQAEIMAEFPIAADTQVPDALYACVDSEWLLGEFSQWWTEFLKSHGLTYGANWDCNRFALAYLAFLAIAHREANPDAQPDTGPAASMVFYWRDDGTRHAICRVRTGRGEGVWIEPQPNAQGQAGQPTRMSAKELGSVWFSLSA